MAKLSTTLRTNLVKAYNEAEELHTNLTTMSDEELIEVKDTMINRTLKIMKQLSKYVTDDDLVNL
jgi:hypothetical protein